MRIALCWNQSIRLADISVRYDLYARGFRRLGHDVITLCSQAAAEGYRESVHTVDLLGDFRDQQLYRSLGIDVVVAVTWLGHMTEEFAAAHRAGSRTVALADSDGQIGVRVHPRHQAYRMVTQHMNQAAKLAAMKFFLQRYIFAAKPEARHTIDNIRHTDVLVFNTAAAVECFESFLEAHGQVAFESRTLVAPYPVDDVFCNRPVTTRKANWIVAIGRWDDPQKDARLLARALEIYYRRSGKAETLLFGRGGDGIVAQVPSARSRIRYLGVQRPDQVADALTAARVLLMTSRWESGPIVAFEALCRGATVVGTPLPNLINICRDNFCGRIATGRSPQAFTNALVEELSAWSNGHRDPERVAAIWQPVCRPDAICSRILARLDGSADTAVA